MKDLRSEYLYRQRCGMGGFLLFVSLLCFTAPWIGGPMKAQGLTVMTYNCENAFDTLHDEGHRDEEYLPEGSRHWTRYRMYQKLKDIGKIIVAADSLRPVDLIGLEEVENDTVLTYLTKRTALASMGYEYIMTHSQDRRGIDVALLYSPYTFRPILHHAIRADTSTPTRDVLHVCGTTGIGQTDTLDIYIVHLPSKLNGMASERNRQKVVDAITASTDSIRTIRPTAKIIIMGDFNDGPDSELMQHNFKGFTNLAQQYSGKEHGSYKYQGTWDTIDQVLISPSLSDPKQNGLKYQEAKVLNLPFLLEADTEYGGTKPKRTYVGYQYHRGFSDHLPVVLRLIKE